LYWENTVGFFDVKGVSVPAAVTVFPNEISKARSWAEGSAAVPARLTIDNCRANIIV
jgi:hypothetical protein